MKPTHIRTPRTLDEGFFERGYTTEPVGRRQTFRAWKFVDRLCAVLFVVLVGLVAVGAL